MNILIYGYGHLTSSIWSGSPSEQIRPSLIRDGGRSIGITRVWTSKADWTKNHTVSINQILPTFAATIPDVPIIDYVPGVQPKVVYLQTL